MVYWDDRGKDDFDRTVSVCTVDTVNLNERLVELSLAWAFRRYSLDFVSIEENVKKQGAGIWQAETQTPWDFRAERWKVAEQVAPKGCPIKGNIRDGKRFPTLLGALGMAERR